MAMKHGLVLIGFLFLLVGLSIFVYADTSCTDSDGKVDDYLTKGSVVVEEEGIGSLTVEDYCLSDLLVLANEYEFYQNMVDAMILEGVFGPGQLNDENILIEAYCPTGIENNISEWFMYYHTYSCPNGCEEGACISEDSCIETDHGFSLYTKGTIEIIQSLEGGGTGTITGTDYCFDASFDVPDGTTNLGLFKMVINEGVTIEEKSSGEYLMETTCASSTLEGIKTYFVAQSYKCPCGCEDGACVEEEKITCTDSDGDTGDYFTKGQVIIKEGAGSLTVEDYCLSDLITLANEYEFYQNMLNVLLDKEVLDSSQLDKNNILLEGYCPSGIENNISEWFMYHHTYDCPHCCSDGACIVSVKSYISNKEVEIEEFAIEIEGKSFDSSLEIVKENSSVYARTSQGDKEIKILPEDAIANADKIEDVTSITINQEGDSAVYVVSGTKGARLFFIIPITAKVKQSINVEEGFVVSIEKPWWSFLARGI